MKTLVTSQYTFDRPLLPLCRQAYKRRPPALKVTPGLIILPTSELMAGAAAVLPPVMLAVAALRFSVNGWSRLPDTAHAQKRDQACVASQIVRRPQPLTTLRHCWQCN